MMARHLGSAVARGGVLTIEAVRASNMFGLEYPRVCHICKFIVACLFVIISIHMIASYSFDDNIAICQMYQMHFMHQKHEILYCR